MVLKHAWRDVRHGSVQLQENDTATRMRVRGGSFAVETFRPLAVSTVTGNSRWPEEQVSRLLADLDLAHREMLLITIIASVHLRPRTPAPDP